MIRVYNKSTNYLRISGKVIAPFKSEEFEERTSQIRVLERNNIIRVSNILTSNTIAHTTLTSSPEVKEEVVEPIIESKEIENPEVIQVESTPESENIEEVKEEITAEPVEEVKVVEPEKEIVEEAKVAKKSTKKFSNKKKGGNK